LRLCQVRIFGCAAAMLERVGVPIAPVNRPDHDRFAEAARRLGDIDFQEAYTKGSQLGTIAAISLATTH